MLGFGPLAGEDPRRTGGTETSVLWRKAAAKVGLAPAVFVLDVLRGVAAADVVVAVEGGAFVGGSEKWARAADGEEREEADRGGADEKPEATGLEIGGTVAHVQ